MLPCATSRLPWWLVLLAVLQAGCLSEWDDVKGVLLKPYLYCSDMDDFYPTTEEMLRWERRFLD